MIRMTALAAAVAMTTQAFAGTILVQSTTSTQNSGLLDAILPVFTEATGITVRVVAVGTGQALDNARRGDGDVVLVHARAAEEAFVAEAHGTARHDVMYNDFVIVGPASDPADLANAASAQDALIRIASAQHPFVSRGDDSGTHKAELTLWSATGVNPTEDSGTWYRETGSGMGASLNVAIGMSAYVLTDRATWLAFGNKAGHRVIFEGDPALFNQYGVILVNPDRHAHINAVDGQAFIDWLRGPSGQASIAAYQVDGQQLFFPNAKP